MRRRWAIMVLLLSGCASSDRPHHAHVEVFEHGRVVLVPAGLGIEAPRRDGAYVRGRCGGPICTHEPTGLIAVTGGGRTLGDLYRVWGRRLGRVTVHVDGTRWRGAAEAVPLRRHAQIVVQHGYAPVLPHARYRFPPGF